MSNNEVVLENPGLKILDTRAMEWEEHPGKTGIWWKVLLRDANGDPVVSLQWAPPDSDATEIPRRYHHQTLAEWAFVVSGERPIWEYSDAEQADGDRVVLREGYFLDRKPGSIHGFEERVSTPGMGVVFLVWQAGSGLLKGERGYEAETFPVPYPTETGT
jgi:hypothetical protein